MRFEAQPAENSGSSEGYGLCSSFAVMRLREAARRFYGAAQVLNGTGFANCFVAFVA
jgi:hypothetical protein